MPKRPEPGSIEGVAHRIKTAHLASHLERVLVDALATARALYTHEPSAISDELLAALEAGVLEVDALNTEGIQAIYETGGEGE